MSSAVVYRVNRRLYKQRMFIALAALPQLKISKMKTLRLSFVLGGGVSLGSFSGAALAESLKRLILFGQYAHTREDGTVEYRRYARITVDVLSGASAGAMSLGLLLRVLSDYRSLYQAMGFARVEDWVQHLERSLQSEYGTEVLGACNLEQLHSLQAAQALQAVQEKIWVEEVDLDKLTGSGTAYKDLSQLAGLFDRGVVEDIAARYFRLSPLSQLGKGYESLSPCPLLGQRLLFACTLGNLNYTLHKPPHAQDKLMGGSRWLKALNDSAIDRVHSEVRIFDLHFRALEEADRPYLPEHWVQYHRGADWRDERQGREKWLRSLDRDAAWREIAATCLASGAFPIAFEPVRLQRYAYEFGRHWPTELQERDSHSFNYVDGGLFNNEPIKEAMRLSNYLDNLPSEEDFDRLVLFVDPNVQELEAQFRDETDSGYSLQHSLISGQAYISRKSSLWRMAGQVPQLLAALLHEAKDLETEKIFEILGRFDSRRVLRQLYTQTMRQLPEPQALLELRQKVAQRLTQVREQLHLPPNSLEPVQELLRIVAEEQAYFQAQGLPVQDKKALGSLLAEFFYMPQPELHAHALSGLQLLTMLMLDLNLGLVAKQVKAKILPIAPFDFYRQALGADVDPVLMTLPGGALAGFAGFASLEAGRYEVAYSRFCTARLLEAEQLCRPDGRAALPPPPFDFSQHRELLRHRIQTALLKRLRELLPEQLKVIRPLIEGFLEQRLRDWLGQQLQGPGKVKTKLSYSFQILVPSKLFTLRYRNAQGRTQALEPLDLGRGRLGFAFDLQYDVEYGRWLGTYVDETQLLHIDRSRLFGEEPAAKLHLPGFPDPQAKQYSQDLQGVLLVQGLVHELQAEAWQIAARNSSQTSLDQTLF